MIGELRLPVRALARVNWCLIPIDDSVSGKCNIEGVTVEIVADLRLVQAWRVAAWAPTVIALVVIVSRAWC